jgi:hypothetical protein
MSAISCAPPKKRLTSGGRFHPELSIDLEASRSAGDPRSRLDNRRDRGVTVPICQKWIRNRENFHCLWVAADQCHPVADGKNDSIDPLVTSNLRIEFSYRDRVRSGFTWVSNSTTPQHIIQDDQTTWPDEPESALVVTIVFLLVGIDESKVERIDYLAVLPAVRIRA